ncbi:MAG: diguanylate cyclase protein [Rhodocyclaceae bacterium]|nr:diguanylate cyclase protein [Rhodocyclaceae bacterium]
MMKLRNFILGASICVAVLFFLASFLLVRHEFDRLVKAQATESSELIAGVSFSAMYELMSTGWTRAQAESFIQSTRAAARDNGHIQIYRGPEVIAQFGAISQPNLDVVVNEALASRQVQRIAEGGIVRHVYPLLAEERCLRCHGNVSVGQALGAIEVVHNMEGLLADADQKLALSLLTLSILAIMGAVIVVLFVNERILKAVRTVEESVNSVNAISDLKALCFTPRDGGFVEFQRVIDAIGEMAEKMHGIAVDKDILRFEIRLLEKFVITSEVVKDWRQYISQLLEEINRILETHFLFSIFEVDDEVFDLEIFWHSPPSEETREMMVLHVRSCLQDHPRFGSALSVNLHHHVHNPNGPRVVLDDAEVALRVKSFFVDTPRIGGIVGIGVHSHAIDDIRSLVMDSVLSTLLNVVGSVKAIYKYTKDLEYYATRDPLTDLYNQRVFWEMLNYEVDRANRHGYEFGLLVIDLDNFKTINDNYGHQVGDRFLQTLAISVRKVLRKDDIFARYGGDEFVVLMPETDLNGTSQTANRVLAAVTQMVLTLEDGTPIKGSASIGMSIFPHHACDAKDLFLFADNLMYKAKSEGKNRVVIPSDEDVAETFRDLSQRSILVLNAIETRQIQPYFQPILDISGRRVVAYECLSRLPYDADVLRADQFIELAEKMGVIHRVDSIVIERALTELATNRFDGLIFFNLSPRALVLNEFCRDIRDIVERSGIPNDRIVFEITERDSVRNLSILEKLLVDLRGSGFKLALDDFGSGFSSFHYLRRFPIDFLKIEGDFIAHLLDDDRDRAFVQNMCSLARQLGIKVIAEFVESQEVLDMLEEMEVDYAQGYHIGRPAPKVLSQTAWPAPEQIPSILEHTE